MTEGPAPGSEFVAGAHVLRLLARLLADGPQPSQHSEWARLPELAELWPGTADPDEDAAAHQELFGFSVLPYAGVFLDTGDEGGESPTHVARRYHRAGFDPGLDDLRPDHLGVELRFVAFLLERGPAGALEAGSFLDEHLLAWLPSWIFAVRRQRSIRYDPVVEFLLDWLLEQRRLLDQVPGFRFAGAGPSVAAPPALLEDDRTGVRDVAAYLVTPAHCGLFIGRTDLARLARANRTPGGFGERRLMMENLLRSAALYDGLDPVFGELFRWIETDSEAWLALASVPGAGLWSETWRSRLALTKRLLETIRVRLIDTP